MSGAAPRFLILASGSPRRRTLLEEHGYRFEVCAPNIAEISTDALTLRELALCNAVRKGISVAAAKPDAIVLAADTLVALEEEIIGKPRNLENAISILKRLSGRMHEVCTAVFIRHSVARRQVAFFEISRVHFRCLTNDLIASYLSKVNPLDKAGGYAAQGEGADIIAKIEGSFTNVVGLPMERTLVELRRFGIEP